MEAVTACNVYRPMQAFTADRLPLILYTIDTIFESTLESVLKRAHESLLERPLGRALERALESPVDENWAIDSTGKTESEICSPQDSIVYLCYRI